MAGKEEKQEEQTFDEAFDELSTPSEDTDNDLFFDDEESAEADDVIEEDESTEESPEEQLAALSKERDDWQHKFESNQGRFAAIQREYNDLKLKVGSAEAPTQEQVADATDSDESWDEFKEEFPEFADAFNKRLEKITTEYERKLDERVGGISTRLEKDDAAKDQAVFNGAVEDAHEGWQETINTPEFKTFLDAQPKSVQQMYNSPDPEDAIYLLDQFTGGKEEPRTDEIKKKRQNRLKRNVSAPRSGSGGRTRPPDDFDSAWDYYAKK